MSNHPSGSETTVPAPDKKTEKLIRTKYKDVLVKAGDDVYYLDRLKLALKSAYFESLFLSPAWNDETTEPINVPLDSDTFGAVVDVIYGSSWSSVLNTDNYIPVLKAKDYLKIVNDSYSFSDFISQHLKNTPISDVKIFELFNSVVGNVALENSLREIQLYLVKNLEHFQNHQGFLSLSIDQFVGMLTSQKAYERDGCMEYSYNLHTYFCPSISNYTQTIRQNSKRSDLVDVCTKWICHDLENRLPLVAKVANAVLEGMDFLKRRIDPNINVKLSDIDEQPKHEVVRRYFERLLNYGTVLNSSVDAPPVKKRKRYNWDSDDDRDTRKEIKKLIKYMKKGSLYDITVKVQEKAYKLHRSILESKSGYLKELFSTEYDEATAQCDGIPSLPNKDKEYVIEEIDKATFDIVIKYVYSNDLPFGKDESFSLFKAAYILKIDELIDSCNSYVELEINKLDFEGRIQEVLDYARGREECKDLYLKYLRRHASNSWPNISHKAEFYSISWKDLEEWLLSIDLIFDDGEKLIDLCSAWIMHDLKTRYQLLKQVALAVKLYGLLDYEDYKLEQPTDLDSISQEMIRNKLWDVVSSLSLIPARTESEGSTPRKFDNEPVFVSLSNDYTLKVQNINMDLLAKLNFGDKCHSMSATIIEDNLFIMFGTFSHRHFLAYNCPSKKFIELSSYLQFSEEHPILLNRRNELYCCSSVDGLILKYSFELNRWMRISKFEPGMKMVRFTSDGDKIYRLYQVPGSVTDPAPGFNVEWYDFEQNQWNLLSSLPSPIPGLSSLPYSPIPGVHVAGDVTEKFKLVDFTVINDTHPAVLFNSVLLWYDLNSHEWHHLMLPDIQIYKLDRFPVRSAIAQGENGIVQVFDDKLYHYSNSNKVWELRKLIEKSREGMRFVSSYYSPLFWNIVAVNRPRVSTA